MKTDSAQGRLGWWRWRVQDLDDLFQHLRNRRFVKVQSEVSFFSSAASFLASWGLARSASRILANARTTKMLI